MRVILRPAAKAPLFTLPASATKERTQGIKLNWVFFVQIKLNKGCKEDADKHNVNTRSEKKLFSVSYYGLHRVEELIFHFHRDCYGVL